MKWALDHPEIEARGRTRVTRKEESTFGPYRRGELEAIAVETSETERRAETAERELMAWKTAQFMEQHLGEEYDALIISVQKFGFFVELTEIFVEGMVPIDRIEELTGEHVFYREQDHAIVSGSGHAQRPRAPARAGQKEKIRPRKRARRPRLETRRPHPRPRRTHRPHSPPRRVFAVALSARVAQASACRLFVISIQNRQAEARPTGARQILSRWYTPRIVERNGSEKL